MPTVDRAEGQVGAPSQPGREFGSGAFLASLALAGSFAALGLNSISISRIEGADGAGLIALSTQFVFITTFVAGGGLRTSVTYRVGAHLWSPRSAIRGAFALAWWILPAVPLARERYETYAWLTVSGPICVLLTCPTLALVAGQTGAVIGFGVGWVLGGVIVTAWSLSFARSREASVGPEHGVREAGGFGARAWVNDLFQLVNVRPDLFILTAYYGISDTGVYAVTVSITSLVWIVSQPLASVVLPRNAMVSASADPGMTPVIPPVGQGAAVRHAVVVSALASVAVIPILAIAPLVWGPDFDRTLTLGLILLPGVALLGVGRVMVAAFTGEGAATDALLVGLVSFPLTFVAFLIVIPDHGSTGAAVVSCCSYVAASLLAAYLFLREPRHSLHASLVPTAEDLRDYVRLARRGISRIAG